MHCTATIVTALVPMQRVHLECGIHTRTRTRTQLKSLQLLRACMLTSLGAAACMGIPRRTSRARLSGWCNRALLQACRQSPHHRQCVPSTARKSSTAGSKGRHIMLHQALPHAQLAQEALSNLHRLQHLCRVRTQLREGRLCG